jgi:hypothetical protein
MAGNLSIESPNFEKIAEESGQFTSDAVGLLWSALNATRDEARRVERRATEMVAPKILTLSPSASVNDLDLEGASVIHFTGGTQNLTGFRAPETGKTRILFVLNSGSGTITAVHEATSESANQLSNASGADVTLATRGGIIYLYLASKWREVA